MTPTGAKAPRGEDRGGLDGASRASGRRANIVGLGLIGGSIGLALRQRGWTVSGQDRNEDRHDQAMAGGVIDRVGLDPTAEITFVATPVGALSDAVTEALAHTSGLVTDVGSVKAPVVSAVDDPRFVGGHPMAGSELIGLDGADADMFSGAVWVLTPRSTTPDATFTAVASIVADLGAEVVAVAAEAHDGLVAVVSHVPHLTAATLMTLADERAEDHAALLRLAAGGFRDMTRIASGHPAIWPDICAENRDAILTTLDQLIEGLGRMRQLVEANNRGGLTEVLERARHARSNLPARSVRPEEMAEVRVPIPDRTGAAAELFTLAAELGVNIASFEVVHSLEGSRGVAVLLVDAQRAELFRGGLLARRFKPSIGPLA
ncbi:MAG: prephenate dehydrogenase [Acidimicrobiales bacterium]